MNKIIFWLNNSRLFSLPMTLMSWLIIFVYSLKEGGSIINGVLALIGISFAHLATNLFDDYVDYRALSKSEEFINSTVKTKCAYIKSGEATLNELLLVVATYCVIASVIGLYLLIDCGIGVFWLALIGGLIVLSYAKLSSNGLSEFAVGTAFGPLLFEGVYYVMTGGFSVEVFLISLAVSAFTVILLYVHTFLDYDGDVISHKKTLCIKIGERFGKIWALNMYLIIATFGYVMLFVMAVLNNEYIYLVPYLTIPFAIFLYISLKRHIVDKNYVPKIRWWNYPLDNWGEIEANGTAPFYFNLFSARNLAMWFQLLTCIAVIL